MCGFKSAGAVLSTRPHLSSPAEPPCPREARHEDKLRERNGTQVPNTVTVIGTWVPFPRAASRLSPGMTAVFYRVSSATI